MCFLSQLSQTPLITAIEKGGSIEIVNVLLNKGADPNVGDKVSSIYCIVCA